MDKKRKFRSGAAGRKERKLRVLQGQKHSVVRFLERKKLELLKEEKSQAAKDEQSNCKEQNDYEVKDNNNYNATVFRETEITKNHQNSEQELREKEEKKQKKNSIIQLDEILSKQQCSSEGVKKSEEKQTNKKSANPIAFIPLLSKGESRNDDCSYKELKEGGKKEVAKGNMIVANTADEDKIPEFFNEESEENKIEKIIVRNTDQLDKDGTNHQCSYKELKVSNEKTTSRSSLNQPDEAEISTNEVYIDSKINEIDEKNAGKSNKIQVAEDETNEFQHSSDKELKKNTNRKTKKCSTINTDAAIKENYEYSSEESQEYEGKKENIITSNEFETDKAKENPDSFLLPNKLIDVALWPSRISEKMIEYFVAKQPKSYGSIENIKFLYQEKGRQYYRKLNASHFFCTKTNGNKEKREWLLFSETTNSIYCFVCKLFSTAENKFKSGFNDFKNITRALSEHEHSHNHIKAMCSYKRRCSVAGRVDTEIMKLRQKEQNYWREILKRVIATVKLLGKLGLAFRGSNEDTESKSKGNFLYCLEYLSEFDDFLKCHLENYGKCGKGNTNYLSHHVYDEFIDLMGDKIKNTIISEIKEAKYFSIILDSTPDISHTDQLTLIIRYINSDGNIQERFLGFIPIDEHKAEYIGKKKF